MNASCAVCSRPSGDVALCAHCESRLVRVIAELPALASELDTTITRQTSSGPSQDYKKAKKELERPSPVNWTASEAAWNLSGTLFGWMPDVDASTCPSVHSITGIGRWLLARMDRIRVHADVAEIHEQFTYAVREAWRSVDRPANRSKVHVAACLDVACPGQLFALIPTDDYNSADPATHAKIQCDACEVTYPAEQWMGLGRRVLATKRAQRAEDAA